MFSLPVTNALDALTLLPIPVEIELRRKLLEKKHEDIINSNLPDIINSIEELVSDENNFYFMF